MSNSKTEKKHYHGHRERLKNRFAEAPDSLADYEILEMLLFYAIPRRDVKQTAKELLSEFGSISAVVNASVERICAIRGISENTALLLKLTAELELRNAQHRLAESELISSPESVIAFARRRIAGSENEKFLVIYLNTKNRLIKAEVANEGTVNRAVIYPRNIIKKALKNNASGIIIVHNHPSGVCDPSSADISLTNEIAGAVNAIDLKLLDHIIISPSEHFSFAEEGLL